jgi:oligopeptide transport system permease protein
VPGRPRRVVWTRPILLVPALVVGLMVVMALAPQLFSGWFGHADPLACQLKMTSQGPSSGHPFGFDVQGCDLYANVVHGARASISIGLLTTAATLLIAVVLGTLAGYFGGWVDMLISRVMDIFFGFPALVGMIVILSVWNRHDVLSISAMLTLFTWPALTRVMRASVIETRSLDYVQAARGVGVGTVRLLVRHVGLNAIGPVIVLAGLNIGAIITAEAALTFLGVGLRSPTISWGVQLNTAQQYFATSPHLLIFPSLLLTITVLAFVMLGDALRDALDPKLTA